MSFWKRAAVAVCLLVTMIVPALGAALARDTPPLTPFPSAATPPRDCTAEPASLDRIREVAGDAIDDPNAVLVEDAPLVAGGDIVSGEASEAVRELARQMIGCVNQNQPARFLSLFTDEFYRRAGAEVAGIIEAAETGDGTEPPLDDMLYILEESDVFALPDGRLAYTIAIGWVWAGDDGEPLTSEQLLQIIAVEQRGVWLIDDLKIRDADAPTPEPDCAGDADGCVYRGGAVSVGDGNHVGWIMPIEVAKQAAAYFLSTSVEVIATFVPTPSQAAEAEVALPAYVAGHPRATEGLIAALSDGSYERQYLGVDTTDGKLLIINAFCNNPSGLDPAKFIIAVEDGGDCYWQAIYDLTAGEFRSFNVNGEA